MHVLHFLDLMSDWKQLLLFASTIDWIISNMQLGHCCWDTRKIGLPTLRARVCYLGTIKKGDMD